MRIEKSKVEIAGKTKVVHKARICVANFEMKETDSRHRNRSGVLQKQVGNFWIGSERIGATTPGWPS